MTTKKRTPKKPIDYSKLPANVEPFVGKGEVSAMTGFRARSLWNAIHQLGLPCYRINARVIKFRLSDVARWMETHRRGV